MRAADHDRAIPGRHLRVRARLRPGQGTYDLFSVVTPVGVTVKRFTKSPFALDSDHDGTLSQDELHPECDEPWPLGALEPVMRGL